MRPCLDGACTECIDQYCTIGEHSSNCTRITHVMFAFFGPIRCLGTRRSYEDERAISSHLGRARSRVRDYSFFSRT